MQITHAFTVSHFPKHHNMFMRSKRTIPSSRVNAYSGPLFGDLKVKVPFIPSFLVKEDLLIRAQSDFHVTI